ncbi:MAG: MBL fold metallo-hydrolase, partial [Bacilli bacterium]|nr:MBL fold metallo-hydrolase [Bacilli bacterium]
MKYKKIFALSISLISLGLNSCTNPIDILFPSSSTPSTSLTQSSSHSEESHLTSSELNYDGIEFHFLTLGNYKAGDSTLIKSGDVEILIDAGSSTSSIDTLKEHINSYCSDGKLEYVIATHAHEDHIAAFTSTSSKKGIFESYEIGTIIDYALTDKTTQIKTKYEEYRQKAVEKGAIHHDASYYFTNEVANEFNSIKISETITMDILYNKYYFEH